jgi:general nucleoside transport system ATP-binding protein
MALAPGEVLGVLGENGAGKSTLMNILAGLVQPDRGSIRVGGKSVQFKTPQDAIAAGIGMVHQHFKLVDNLTVEENLALGDPRWGRGVIDYAQIRKEIAALAADLGIRIDPGARIDELPIGRQQQVEILKSLWRRPRVLILDEPTALLAPEERQGLFDLVRRMKAQGAAVILISHKLEDIVACCDRVLVMRQGRVVDSGPVAGRSQADLVRMVVGGELAPVPHKESAGGEALLSVEDLQVRRTNGSVAVAGASFELRAGEILGLCGVEGNGQSELMQTLAGILAPTEGKVLYRSKSIAHIPEDRLRYGLIASMTLAGNWLLGQLDDARFNRRGWLRWPQVCESVREALASHDVKVPGERARAEQLSGGNQQKLVLARELARNPSIILAAHPSRGLDVRTVVFVHRALLEARDRGAAVLLLSADLAELWAIADRIMVMVEGRLRGPVPVSQTSQQEIGHWMTVR